MPATHIPTKRRVSPSAGHPLAKKPAPVAADDELITDDEPADTGTRGQQRITVLHLLKAARYGVEGNTLLNLSDYLAKVDPITKRSARNDIGYLNPSHRQPANAYDTNVEMAIEQDLMLKALNATESVEFRRKHLPR